MKSIDIQNLVLKLAKEKKSIRNISDHVRGQVSKSTIQRWIARCNTCGKLVLKRPPGDKRRVRTKKLITKVKNQLKTKQQHNQQDYLQKSWKLHVLSYDAH